MNRHALVDTFPSPVKTLAELEKLRFLRMRENYWEISWKERIL